MWQPALLPQEECPCSNNTVWNIHPWKVNDRSSANNQVNNTVELSDQDSTLLCALPAYVSAHRS